MSQPPGPPNPYGGTPQQPYGQPLPPGVPPQSAYGYGQPAYGVPQQPDGYGGYHPLPGGMPPLASWGSRLGALLLDFLMFSLIPLGLMGAGYLPYAQKVADATDACHNQGISTEDCGLPDPTGTNVLLILVGLVLSLAAFFYLSYREGKTGQTPGKRICGIRVLREHDGSALGFGRAFGRRWAHVLDALPCHLGYLWPLWDEKNQTWADKMASSVVIKDQF